MKTRHPSRPQTSVDTNILVSRWREHGDQAARDELFERFLPLARKLAGRYASPHEPVEDLVQVASIGLLGAINRFDPHRGVGFPGFAVPTILGELKRHFRSTGWTAHVPRGAQEMALRVDRAIREMAAHTGRTPRVAELAHYLEVRPEDVLDGLDASGAHYSLSLDAPGSTAAPDERATLGETMGCDDEGYGLVETTLSVSAAITRLPYRERRALTLRLVCDMKQVDIAQQLGCSQMQVSRLLRCAAGTVRAMTHPTVGSTSRDSQIPR